VHAFAVPLFGLEGSLDGVPLRNDVRTVRTAVVYRSTRRAIMIPPLSLHPPPCVPCGSDMALLHSRPGSRRGKVPACSQYRLRQMVSLLVLLHVTIKV
jgi:hypothetical protein